MVDANHSAAFRLPLKQNESYDSKILVSLGLFTLAFLIVVFASDVSTDANLDDIALMYPPYP
jgi:hypothetical protein